MKKVISIALVIVLAFSVIALVGCGDKTGTDAEAPAAALKFGMGVVSSYTAKSATEEANGEGEFNTTAVAVLLDADNKIVAIDLDTAQIKPQWTADGKKVDVEDLRTKYDKGTDYNMATYGANMDKNGDGKVLEWNEQADAFMATAIGKTLDEIKAFAGEDMYAIGDLATAGCTINVAEFIGALEKAINNAEETTATADDTIKVALVTSQYYESKDATEEAEGLNQYDTTVVAAVTDAEGKVIIAKTDAAQAKFGFDAKGVVTSEAGDIATKLELGDDYNMATYGANMDKNGDGKVLEWYAQADAFNAALVGKTAADFAALAGADTYATGDLAAAGCTMAIGDMIKAAEAAVKAA